MLATPIGRLRLVGLLEGASFLLLLGVAMPLKYLAGLPAAVKVAGWTHGVLFMVFLMVLMHAAHARGWSILRTFVVFFAALVPFGPFVIDGRLRREDEVAAAAVPAP